ncbi:hypothetical protein JCM8547_002648 [Rhodosporidiobolus lusitaniae]
MVKPMHEQDPRVKLLTVLNVQSAKPAKRSASSSSSSASGRDWYALARKANAGSLAAKATGAEKARKRLGGKLAEAAKLAVVEDQEQGEGEEEGNSKKRRKVEEKPSTEEEDPASDDDESDSPTSKLDSFALHFASSSNPFLPDSLDPSLLALADGKEDPEAAKAYWRKEKMRVVEPVGEAVVFRPRGLGEEEVKTSEVEDPLATYNPKLLEKLRTMNDKEGKSSDTPLSWLSLLSTYRDVLYPKLELGDAHDEIRQAASLHAMNHVLKTRSKILKNNEYLSRLAASTPAPSSASGNKKGKKSTTAPTPPSPAPAPSLPTRDTTDQSFTRPKILILAPFRSSALSWVSHLLSFLPPTCTQIEQYPRFVSEFSLPEGTVDKLLERPDDYPEDHRETFAGNVDDAFRVGVKVTRRTARVFSGFYESDIIVASPLGLRTSIEKDGDADFLSSIEMVVVDQMDVMEMQNWEHVQFVMSRLNLMPQTDHGCDFSRVKPFYLNALSSHLRQSLLLSRFETPEIRSLFSHNLLNRAGKVKGVVEYEGVMERVPRGVRQVWTRFEGGEVWEEEEKRFEWFTTKTLPTLLRSALSSSQTLLVVPSYFDFLRLKRFLTTSPALPSDFSFAAISEYTDTPDVSRARGAFMQGRVKWLVVTERFHFYKRYRLRGALHFIFYAPPLHPLFYPEILSFPFMPPSSLSNPSASDFSAAGLEGDVDESELSCHVLFSRWDLLRLERIVGTRDARRMVKEGQGQEGEGGKRFTFL